jgi:phenylacetate-CoA ligase
MNTKLNKFILKIYFKCSKEPFFSALSNLQNNDYKTTDEIRALQWKKTKLILDHAYSSVPYYKKLFRDNKIHPTDIQSSKDMELIPTTDKSVFRKQFNEFKSNKYTGQFYKAKTSGSTGTSLSFFKDRETTAFHRASIYRGLNWHGIKVGNKQARLWGVPISNYGNYKLKLIDFLLNRFREKSINLKDDILYEFYIKIKQKKPHYMKGYPSMVYEFAKFIDRNSLNGKNLSLRLIECTAESLYSYQKFYSEKIFSCPVISQYGCAETGIISFECPQRNNHLMADCIFEELLPHSTNKVNDNLYDLIITDLNNFSYPLIRYQIGDIVTKTSNSCSCGIGLPLIGKVQGRTCDFIIDPNGVKHHDSVLTYSIRELSEYVHTNIIEFRAIQEKKGELIINLVSDNINQNAIDVFETLLKSKLGQSMKFYFTFVDKLERDTSGKLRYFISKI